MLINLHILNTSFRNNSTNILTFSNLQELYIYYHDNIKDDSMFINIHRLYIWLFYIFFSFKTSINTQLIHIVVLILLI